jgi:hypothetical protein
MGSHLLTRADLATVLTQWLDGRLTAHQVHEWAEERAGNDTFDVDDWEGIESNSVANEVLRALDMLDMNLMLPDDIPFYLEFLGTLEGQFYEGYRKWQDALNRIDYGARKEALRANPLHAPFCV